MNQEEIQQRLNEIGSQQLREAMQRTERDTIRRIAMQILVLHLKDVNTVSFDCRRIASEVASSCMNMCTELSPAVDALLALCDEDDRIQRIKQRLHERIKQLSREQRPTRETLPCTFQLTRDMRIRAAVILQSSRGQLTLEVPDHNEGTTRVSFSSVDDLAAQCDDPMSTLHRNAKVTFLIMNTVIYNAFKLARDRMANVQVAKSPSPSPVAGG